MLPKKIPGEIACFFATPPVGDNRFMALQINLLASGLSLTIVES